MFRGEGGCGWLGGLQGGVQLLGGRVGGGRRGKRGKRFFHHTETWREKFAFQFDQSLLITPDGPFLSEHTREKTLRTTRNVHGHFQKFELVLKGAY